jgi:hypothetical protein
MSPQTPITMIDTSSETSQQRTVPSMMNIATGTNKKSEFNEVKASDDSSTANSRGVTRNDGESHIRGKSSEFTKNVSGRAAATNQPTQRSPIIGKEYGKSPPIAASVPRINNVSNLPEARANSATEHQHVNSQSGPQNAARSMQAREYKFDHNHLSHAKQSRPHQSVEIEKAPPAVYNMHRYARQYAPAPYTPAGVMQTHRHPAANANTASAVTDHSHVNRTHNTNVPGGRDVRNQFTQNNSIMNHRHHDPSSNPSNFAQTNRPVASNSDSGGRQLAMARSIAIGQHQAAAKVAEQHVQWIMQAYEKKKQENSNNGNVAAAAVVEVEDDSHLKDKLIQQYTEAIARQLNSADAAAIEQQRPGTNNRNSEYQDWRDQVPNNSARKRGLSEPNDRGNYKHVTVNRQSLPSSDNPCPPTYIERATSKSSMDSSSRSNRPRHLDHQGPNSSNQVVNVKDAMNVALDATITLDTSQGSQRTSASGQRLDTPMIYLIRQLLGQVEVLGDEPAVVFAPHLVKDASLKIRLVINKLIEMIVMKAKKDSQAQIREVEARFTAMEEKKRASERDNAADSVAHADHQKSMQSLRAFAEDKCVKLAERDKVIEQLRKKLQAHDMENENSRERQDVSLSAGLDLEKKSNTTIRHLIAQLDEGITEIQRQKRENVAFKAVIEKNTETLIGNRDLKSYLEGILTLYDVSTKEKTYSKKASQITQTKEIVSLKNEVAELRATLHAERQQSENTLRAYMRAAVHALKIQNEELHE